MERANYPTDPILLVDDEPAWLHTASMLLRAAGFTHLVPCREGDVVLDAIAHQAFSAVMLDLSMPGVSGHELLESIVREAPGLPVIVVTGADRLDTAVQCMRLGAFDYFVKSSETDRLVSAVQRAVTVQELAGENRRLQMSLTSGELRQPEAFREIVTQDARMRGAFQYVEAVAPSPRPVLITGESGVGKELIAKAIHKLSGRKGQFVAINSAGLDDQMCADTLFGHVAGAYTGADGSRAGLVERAAGGTLFLDEIGDMSALSQAKLLRLLQEGEYTPLGSDVPRKSDARIVAATNQDLRALQDSGRFRRDLFFRISTHSVAIPPLRQRKTDIPLLVEHFLTKAAATLNKRKPTTTPFLFALLQAYAFPGNVRELEAMVFDAVSRETKPSLSLDSFRVHINSNLELDPSIERPCETGAWAIFSDPLPTLEQVGELLVQEALRRANGSQSLASSMLGVSRQALNKRVRTAQAGRRAN